MDEMQIPEELLNTELGGTRRRRLHRKTAATADHGYTARLLQKLQDHRVHMHKFKSAQQKQRAEIKIARRNAIELLAMQPPPGAFGGEVELDTGQIQNPHSSHRILGFEGNSSTIYCRNCGAWAARAKLRLLAGRCTPLKEGNRHNLRLLQCGIMPAPLARIPAHMRNVRTRRGRKSRW